MVCFQATVTDLISGLSWCFFWRHEKTMLTHWQDHKNRLRAYIARQVHDQATVDDILQDVYLKAHEQLHKLKSLDSLGAWLYRIAHNAIMDHYRRQKPFEELSDEYDAPEEDNADKAHQEIASCLTPLIEELPEKYRIPLRMSELEGMSQQKVADELGLSLSGAKSRVQRGRAQLRNRLTDCCDIEVGRGGVVDYQPKAESSDCKMCDK